ncbi:MAG: monofunctional biosynthetic peptidoglycan transglycosylase [Bacteroidales bacterium]|nr:monofunctional biosynthetic peptidoglycan transglycosylase [Bacteroidales bacterium]
MSEKKTSKKPASKGRKAKSKNVTKGWRGLFRWTSWSQLSWWRRVCRVSWLSVVAVWLSTVAVVILYRYVNPPFTPLMVQRFFEQYHAADRHVNFERDYVSINDISPNLVDAVVYSEDGLFMYHKGFDIKQIRMSYLENKQGRRVRGGSTISQQTAKNAFLPHTRSMLRKGLEAYFTGLIELFWGKKRIMEVYLNIIEFGDGIYGCEAAAQHYFGHSAKALTPNEAAQLAVCLPSPLRMNPDHHGSYFTRQSKVVEKRLAWGRVNLDMTRAERKDGRYKPETFWDLLLWVLKGMK